MAVDHGFIDDDQYLAGFEIFPCVCGRDAVVVADEGNGSLSVTFWHQGHALDAKNLGFGARLIEAWRWLIGKPRVTSAVFLSPTQVEKLSVVVSRYSRAHRMALEERHLRSVAAPKS